MPRHRTPMSRTADAHKQKARHWHKNLPSRTDRRLHVSKRLRAPPSRTSLGHRFRSSLCQTSSFCVATFRELRNFPEKVRNPLCCAQFHHAIGQRATGINARSSASAQAHRKTPRETPIMNGELPPGKASLSPSRSTFGLVFGGRLRRANNNSIGLSLEVGSEFA